MKKPTKIVLLTTGVVIAVILLITLIFFVWTYIRIRNGDLIEWNNKWYTKQELKKAFPPQYIEVPAKNTPEQVYIIFRQALLDNDIEKALSLFVKSKREEYRQAFKNKEKFDKWVKRFPEFLIKESEYGNFASYYYLNIVDSNDKMAHPATFMKNEYGYWQIDNI